MSPARRSRTGRKGAIDTAAGSRRSMLFGLIALAVAIVALWSLVTTVAPEPGRMPETEEPLGEIGDASREQLREVLRGAEAEDQGEAR